MDIRKNITFLCVWLRKSKYLLQKLFSITGTHTKGDNEKVNTLVIILPKTHLQRFWDGLLDEKSVIMIIRTIPNMLPSFILSKKLLKSKMSIYQNPCGHQFSIINFNFKFSVFNYFQLLVKRHEDID